ncbi:MAG: SDR family oxidoreductase [Bryobacteraceae bacterium]|nr:SDR family oxidoreductase [Bryobacteraceae bacterium]
MNLDLHGKTALVTGGSRGIGRAIVERLLEAGAGVAFCGRDGESLSRTLDELRQRFAEETLKILARAADVRSEASVRELFEWIDLELGGPDILVNNAGVGVFRDVAALSPEEWSDVIETNLGGVYRCSHHAIPRMRARGGGWIINIGSLAGRNAFAGGAAYNASKFGLVGMSEAMMLDHRHEGIRVACILPGSVNTGFGHGQQADWKMAPEDVAEAVAAVLALPERTLVRLVGMRPSRPPRR